MKMNGMSLNILSDELSPAGANMFKHQSDLLRKILHFHPPPSRIGI